MSDETLDDDLFERTYKDASKNKRIINAFIDTLAILMILALIDGLPLMWFNWDRAFTQVSFFRILNNFVFNFIIGSFYYTTFEHYTGFTLGKWLTQTKVIDIHHKKPSFLNAMERSFCRFVFPVELFLFVKKGKVWHDQVSKTRVVETN